MKYFAVYDGSVGEGQSVGDALEHLQDQYDVVLKDVKFYKGEKVEVEIVEKKVPIEKKVETLDLNKPVKKKAAKKDIGW